MKVVIFSPTRTSLFSRLVTYLAHQEPRVEVVGIVERSIWDLKRLRSELRRDGSRLLRKVYRKLILGGHGYQHLPSDNLLNLAKTVGLPQGNLKQLAKRWGIEFIQVGDLNGPEVEGFLQRKVPEVVAFTGGGLLRKNVLNKPKIGVLNCHMGILPRYRGMDVVEWPVAEGRLDQEGIGLTLHIMDQGVDTGPILLKSRYALHPGDTFEAIRARLEPMMARLMLDGICSLRDGSITPTPQQAEDGKQFFIMHPRLLEFSRERLKRTHIPERPQ